MSTAMTWITLCIIFFCVANFAEGQFDAFVRSDPDTIVSDEIVDKKFAILESRVKMLSQEAIKLIFSSAVDAIGSLNVSRTCFRDCTKLLLGVRKLNTWAVKFLDATTKISDGLLNFDPISLGAYDECVDNKVLYDRPKKLKGQVMFQGKYCNVHIRTFHVKDEKAALFRTNTAVPGANDHKSESIFHEIKSAAPMTYFASLRGGLCLPSGCSIDDANSILRLVSDYFGISLKATTCVVKEEKKYTPIMIAVMSIYSFTGLIMLVGTVVDFYCHFFEKDFKSTGIQIFKAFSFISNFKKITNFPDSTNVGCLNGMRFLSMSWIILSHTYMYHVLIHHTLPKDFAPYLKDLAFQVVENGFFAVDTFFFISGFLTCYMTVKLVKNEKKPFSLKFYLLHRIWRIIPAYAFVIGFEFLKPLMGSGPLYHEIFLHDKETCKKNWWTNFLFINNYYRNENICVPQSWFIAVDTQLYVLALIILLPLMKWPKIGVFMAILAVAAGTTATGIMSYRDKTLAIFTFSAGVKDLNTWHHYHNMSLHLHAAPFVIGLLLGYLLAIRSDFKISKIVQLLGWSLSAAICLSVIYGVQKFNSGVKPTVLEIITYSCFSRLAWALGISWMTFCCSTGHGGVVNYILSWNLWVPLSRLTYVAYLVHVSVLLAYNGSLRRIPHFQHYLVVWIFLGNLLITYAVAFVGYILVESPFASLERILVFRNQKDALHSVENSAHVQNNLNNKGNEAENLKNLETNIRNADNNFVINGFERNEGIDQKHFARM